VGLPYHGRPASTTGIQFAARGRDKNNQRILTYLWSVKYLSDIDDKITSKNAEGKKVKNTNRIQAESGR
jgi:hypothetical protein